jgi:hypothetical protein
MLIIAPPSPAAQHSYTCLRTSVLGLLHTCPLQKLDVLDLLCPTVLSSPLCPRNFCFAYLCFWYIPRPHLLFFLVSPYYLPHSPPGCGTVWSCTYNASPGCPPICWSLTKMCFSAAFFLKCPQYAARGCCEPSHCTKLCDTPHTQCASSPQSF